MKQNHATTPRQLVKPAAVTAVLAALCAAGPSVTPAQAHSHHGHPGHHGYRGYHGYHEHAHGSSRGGGSFESSGIASVYSGGRTASGEAMNSRAMTAAHRSLPFGTQVTVTNHHNGRVAVVRINDRGPFVRGRVIDLSPAAASVLGISGLAPVSLRVGDRRSL